MFLEVHADTRRKTPYYYGLFRETYRLDGRVQHRTRGRVTGLTHLQLLALRDFVRAGCPDPAGFTACRVKSSLEWGACHAVLAVLQDLGLERMIYSRREDWVRYVLAMIVGRVVYQGSKLSLTNLWRDTALWSLVGLGEDRPEVDDCYQAMDHLLERQPAIQKALARKHLQDGSLVLYDVTSSYFEGEYVGSELVDWGYNRDGKRGHKQVVIGVMAASDGCPVGVSVYRGNTNDQKTLPDRVRELKQDYRLKEMILAGDRGMITSARLEGLSEAGLRSVTALTHPQIQRLIAQGTIQAGLFDEHQIAEVYDPDQPAVRYLLCRNPLTAQKETHTRQALIEKTSEGLQRIAGSRRKRTAAAVGAAVGKVLARWKGGKFFAWQVKAGRLTWSLNTALVEQEQALDGCYVVRTDVSASLWDKAQAVAAYRSLSLVEQAIRQLKTVSLEVRPTYHHLDDRIKAHVFLCMLGYYVQWHMTQRLTPLFAEDGEGSERRWTFAGVVERLKSIRQETVEIGGTEVQLTTTPDEEQAKLLELLKVAV